MVGKICNGEVGGQLPSDIGDVFPILQSPLELRAKDSTALMFIEEVVEQNEPAERPLGRFGMTVPSPAALVGVARRSAFYSCVTVLEYDEIEKRPDAYWLKYGIDFITSWKSLSKSTMNVVFSVTR